MRVGGAPATNPARLVTAQESVSVAGPAPRFVGRGGDKLQGALEHFALDLTGKRILDVGSSTGGFTDSALQAGAATVVAVDVGRGQLHQRLLVDPRVEVHEQCNIRSVAPGDLGSPADVAVADLSFISLAIVVNAVVGLLRPGADLIWLIKPQFEATRAEVSAGRGVIDDPAIWSRVLLGACGTLTDAGATIMGVMASPLQGAEGNREFFVHATLDHHEPPRPDGWLHADIDAAVAQVVDR